MGTQGPKGPRSPGRTSACQGDSRARSKKSRIAGPDLSSYTPVLALSETVTTPTRARSPTVSGEPPAVTAPSGAFVMTTISAVASKGRLGSAILGTGRCGVGRPMKGGGPIGGWRGACHELVRPGGCARARQHIFEKFGRP